jgi:hypothetical protein
MKMIWPVLVLGAVAMGGAAGCTVSCWGPGGDSSGGASGGSPIRSASFAKGINNEGRPVNLTKTFFSNETIYLSVVIKGRPTSGFVGFTFRNSVHLLGQATADMAEGNKGTVFSFGQDTYSWCRFNIGHQTLPLGDYFIDVTYNGEKVGTYSTSIVPPASATPSKVLSATLCKGYQGDFIPTMPTRIFDPPDEVYLIFRADLGIETWVQANWYINGQLAPAGTRSFTAQENVTNRGFSFSLRPTSSLPAGQHYVVLTMNDQEVGRYDFVTSSLPADVPPTGVPPVGTPPTANPSSM